MPGFGSNEIRVGTPDASRYHDASEVRIESRDRTLLSLLPSNGGYAGLRGVVIPRSTEDGASRGFDHNAPQKIYVNLGPNAGAVLVDVNTLREQSQAVSRALSENLARYGDRKQAAVATYQQFALAAVQGDGAGVVSMEHPHGSADVREAPLAMPGSYVVPKALPGGGQAVTQPQQQKMAMLPQFPNATQSQVPPQFPNLPNHQPSAPVNLRDAFSGVVEPPQASQARPPRKVTFEIQRAGQITTYYHAVIRSDIALVLVYDHSRAGYPHYVPPVLEATDGTPEPILVLVHKADNEPTRLYMAYYGGFHFVFGGCEFFILTIEDERVLADDNAR